MDNQKDINNAPKATIQGIAVKDSGEKKPPRTEFEPGTILKERYSIVRSIGKGGFGIVYEAKDLQNNEMRVAIKTLKHNLEDYDRAQKRFQREIDLCRSINNEHAVKIYDSGRADDDTLFYVMEFLDGTSLDDHLARREIFTFVETKRIMIQALSALEEAHNKGIVHRDIKPANICLLKKDEDSRDYEVKVLDFGIAKVVAGEDQPGGEKLTQTGAWMGSPAYMSPEHLRGGVVTPASDVFAMGLVGLEMLTGYPAVDGESPMDVAMTILSQDSIVIEDWILDSSLGNVLARCVNKNPSARYQNAGEVKDALLALSDTDLINEHNAAKISGKLSRRRSTMSRTSSVNPNLPAPTIVGASSANSRERNLAMMFGVGIFIFLFIIGTILLVKVLIDKNLEDIQLPAAESGKPEKRPAYITGLSRGLAKGYGQGVSELMRFDIYISTIPEGATLYRAADNSEIGKTPLTVSPVAAPFNSKVEPWQLILRADGYEDYPLAIIPKIGTSPSMNISLHRLPLGPDGKPIVPPANTKPEEPAVIAAPEPAPTPEPAPSANTDKPKDSVAKTDTSKSKSGKKSGSSSSQKDKKKNKNNSWNIDTLTKK
ncbi:MAG: serine/threonine protein kinase [Proteobacteria bacterium]|nr:serine/threonine protein kinase [Pseudomonadota bacterium]